VRKIGILALQGAVREHAVALVELGAHPVEVRSPEDLSGIDGLVLPGGESTTMSLLLESAGLFDAVAERLAAGMPALGTCAGMILLGVIDLTVRRNAFGRQVDSFETELDIVGLGADPFDAVFIRAPFVERAGDGVEVLAAVDGHPVLCRQGAVVASAFHPELSNDLRVHALFLGEY